MKKKKNWKSNQKTNLVRNESKTFSNEYKKKLEVNICEYRGKY